MRYYLTILLIVLFVGQNLNSLAQPKENDKHYQVKWISTFSSKADLNISTGFFKKLKNFFFGSDEFDIFKPMSIIASDSNNYVIVDQGLKSIIQIKKQDNVYIRTNPEDYNLPSLVGISRFAGNKYLVTDSKIGKIYIFDPSNMELNLLNDSLKLSQPTGIAFNSEKNEIIVSETNLHQITILNDKGYKLKTIGARGNDSAQFNFPTFLTLDKFNNLYVVDAMNFRVQIFDENYNLKYIFGEHGDGAGFINSPKAIALDSYGHIYLVDAMMNSVQIFDKIGYFLYSFGTQGNKNGELYTPTGISIDKNNRIYITDTNNSRIQVFQLMEGE